MNWILANWPAVIAILGGLLGVAAAIAKLTPSTKDDAIVAKAEEIVADVEKVLPSAPTPPKV